jgi:motility quorum-sensing regulator / GCU-specific mRNA interferase toxin
VEKRSAHYDLSAIRQTFSTIDALRITRSAIITAEGMGLTLSDIVALIQTIMRKHFYKSMTSIADTRIWQDVYHVPCGLIVLYVKFTTDAEGYLVISFKEK